MSPPGTSPPARADGLTSLGQLQLRHSLDGGGAAPAGLRPAASLTFIDRPLGARLSGDLDLPTGGAHAEVSEQAERAQHSQKSGEWVSGQPAVPDREQAEHDGGAVTNQLEAELPGRFGNEVRVDGSKAKDDWSEFVG